MCMCMYICVHVHGRVHVHVYVYVYLTDSVATSEPKQTSDGVRGRGGAQMRSLRRHLRGSW